MRASSPRSRAYETCSTRPSHAGGTCRCKVGCGVRGRTAGPTTCRCAGIRRCVLHCARAAARTAPANAPSHAGGKVTAERRFQLLLCDVGRPAGANPTARLGHSQHLRLAQLYPALLRVSRYPSPVARHQPGGHPTCRRLMRPLQPSDPCCCTTQDAAAAGDGVHWADQGAVCGRACACACVHLCGRERGTESSLGSSGASSWPPSPGLSPPCMSPSWRNLLRTTTA